MTILIIGLMCSGKTSIGKALAKEFHLDFIEMDPLVLAETGMHSVQEVFEIRPSLWKEAEFEVMRNLSEKASIVVACSGDIIENDINFQYFREKNHEMRVLYLHTTPETIAKRLVASHDRVKLKDQDGVQKNVTDLYKKRDPLYRKYASLVVDTDESVPADVVASILKEWA
jgi:shikimate kinase